MIRQARGARLGQPVRVPSGRPDAVDERDRDVIERCLRAAVEGPFFPDWEFHALFGLDREEVRAVLSAWPAAPTEVPDGYEPISFTSMKPDEMEERGGKVIPDHLRQLDGQRVFIKGYMRPQEFKSNLAAFLLVRDNQQCCFGPLSNVKYFDQVGVELVPPLKADYSSSVYRVGGRLKINPEFVASGGSVPVYTLVADYLR